jgi:hypothetical protein
MKKKKIVVAYGRLRHICNGKWLTKYDSEIITKRKSWTKERFRKS